MEMYRRLRFAGRARREAEQRHSSRPCRRLRTHRFAQRQTIELGVVIGGAIEADDRLEEPAAAWRRPRTRRSASCRIAPTRSCPLSTICFSSPARSIGIVLATTAPTFVAASQQATIAGIVGGTD